MTDEKLDEILSLQLVVAWSGEANTDPPRMGWWRTAMCDEFGGEDLLKRLAPRTWKWAVLEAARAAAERLDDRIRNTAENPDHLLTLFRLGFETDEALDERLLQLKQSGAAPSDVFPVLKDLCGEWLREAFAGWLGSFGEVGFSATATGRRLKSQLPADLCEAAKQLTAALLPLDSAYVLPHFRLSR